MPKFKKDKDVNEFSMKNPLQPVKNMAYWKAKNESTSPYPFSLGKDKEDEDENKDKFGIGKAAGLAARGVTGRWKTQDAKAAHMSDAYKNIYG